MFFLLKRDYTTNLTERSAAATKRSTSESDLESSVGSHPALAEQWPIKSVERSASTEWDSKGGLTLLTSRRHTPHDAPLTLAKILSDLGP